MKTSAQCPNCDHVFEADVLILGIDSGADTPSGREAKADPSVVRSAVETIPQSATGKWNGQPCGSHKPAIAGSTPAPVSSSPRPAMPHSTRIALGMCE